MVIDFSGRFNGEAFVQFTNMGDAQRALEKHKQKIGNRFVIQKYKYKYTLFIFNIYLNILYMRR